MGTWQLGRWPELIRVQTANEASQDFPNHSGFGERRFQFVIAKPPSPD